MKENLIDMHIHTKSSDGEYTLEEIVEILKNSEVKTFSITDHDNIESHKKIKELDLGNLEFFNGVEVSSKLGKINMHILGYGINNNPESLNRILNEIKEKRVARFMELVDMVRTKYSIRLSEEDVIKVIDNNEVPGKPHLIKLIYKAGYGVNNKEIYNAYLKEYKSKINYKADVEEVISSIKKENGLVILAHPREIETEYEIEFEEILPELISLGIDGIEVYNSIHNLAHTYKYLTLVNKYNFLVSGGSDYHGPFTKPHVKLGLVTKEGMKIKELSLVDELRRRE